MTDVLCVCGHPMTEHTYACARVPCNGQHTEPCMKCKCEQHTVNLQSSEGTKTK